MSTTTAAGLLRAWRDRIAALTPTTQVAPGDVFHVEIGASRQVYRGSRDVLLSALPGVRSASARSCSDWVVDLACEVYYHATPPESDDDSVYLRAIEDAETICNDLYAWATGPDADADGLLRVEPAPASVAEADNEIVVARFVRVLYRGSA